MTPQRYLQTSSRVLMVRPHHFTFNTMTASDNYFQSTAPTLIEHAHEDALQEFDDFVALLRSNDIEVVVAQDTAEPATPDSIFPNNWFSTHLDGTLILYPMLAENRNQESYKSTTLDTLQAAFRPTRILDLRPYRDQGWVLEGTGCMVLDRVHRIAYACRSERLSEELFELFCREVNFRPILFDAIDREGHAIYHTNVMMTLAEHCAVVCLESLPNASEREQLVASLESTGHEVIPIHLEQVYSFAGNMLSLHRQHDGAPLMVMSQRAYQHLDPEQRTRIEHYASIVSPQLTTIETLGGGSARCMMGEIYYHDNTQAPRQTRDTRH